MCSSHSHCRRERTQHERCSRPRAASRIFESLTHGQRMSVKVRPCSIVKDGAERPSVSMLRRPHRLLICRPSPLASFHGRGRTVPRIADLAIWAFASPGPWIAGEAPSLSLVTEDNDDWLEPD